VTNCLHNKRQKQYMAKLDYVLDFLSPLAMLLKEFFSSLLFVQASFAFDEVLIVPSNPRFVLI
jgi:hypothetical protein